MIHSDLTFVFKERIYDSDYKSLHGIFLFPEECCNQFIKIYSIKLNLKYLHTEGVLNNRIKSNNNIHISICPIINKEMN